jgi:hypothetical protein
MPIAYRQQLRTAASDDVPDATERIACDTGGGHGICCFEMPDGSITASPGSSARAEVDGLGGPDRRNAQLRVPVSTFGAAPGASSRTWIGPP